MLGYKTFYNIEMSIRSFTCISTQLIVKCYIKKIDDS